MQNVSSKIRMNIKELLRFFLQKSILLSVQGFVYGIFSCYSCHCKMEAEKMYSDETSLDQTEKNCQKQKSEVYKLA